MFYSCNLILIGYILLALKVFNLFIFQVFGLLGYLLIGIGVYKLSKSKETKLGAFAAFGLFLLMGYSFVKPPVTKPETIDIVFAIVQTLLYVLLNWVLIYFMFEEIHSLLKSKKMVDDVQLCKKNKTKFMNLIFYSVLCQNGVFMFPKLGAILFLIGVGLAIYLSIIQVIYFYKVSRLIQC
ncbi:MAG: hypothetical protein E6248_11205 [Clostridium sp.]|uniref:hypothetical protein n=1 Tax=Clostridium sp. TaxID=1506 RepID=UPI00290C0FB3|nr:hypothetical protein [Clostridium sp.]MDU5111007.1 hypothetical protein [Clostridium sp.]